MPAVPRPQHRTLTSTSGAPGDHKARALKELLGDTEVSVSGRNYHGKAEAIDYLMRSYKPGPPSLPPSSPETIRKAAEDVARRLHRAPESHWESGRGGTFIHNHPQGAAALSATDIEAARKYDYQTMIVVSPRDGILIVHRPPDGWKAMQCRPNSLAEHDAELASLGARLERKPLSELPKLLDDAARDATEFVRVETAARRQLRR
ncbi:MAG TPA: hypothetical protein VGX78_15390 [Pirellulales bacterium]|jgi:proteasome lid subunit RPN8/RPN11|nr:hypothetical protein [Pirellulales bacterium]